MGGRRRRRRGGRHAVACAPLFCDASASWGRERRAPLRIGAEYFFLPRRQQHRRAACTHTTNAGNGNDACILRPTRTVAGRVARRRGARPPCKTLARRDAAAPEKKEKKRATARTRRHAGRRRPLDGVW
ncbi:hypothetical protein BU14_1407s0001 [Porphyra umbilicalis]|uniref:Uncharacterized protein n=1 Tax=Porphyra umbilicalis TaxID=2786 RepID=A0A1X6NLM2_PORUM|nr:hypothetical protein BU14_1407s0001 [Porphyra umbilicalis]|eukprot:OSX69541.1 hypothetical protein BU14_1407s0001 [Porphyra umbilicalis]